MNRLILWFSRHKIFTIIVSAVYFAAVVRFHEEVSKVSVWVQTMLSLRLYNKVITFSGLFLVIAVSILVFIKIKNGEKKALKVFYWCFTLLMTGIAYNTLMVVNVESIHFAQYALLAFPVFALAGSFGETVLIVTLLGAIDEANQHFVLHNWKYFDFNDIILNLLGAAIGALIILTLFDDRAAPERFCRRRLIKSPFLAVTASILFAGFLLYINGLLSLYPGPESSKALFVLSNIPPSDKFWISFEWDKTYHILKPAEGMLIAALLITGCSFMDHKHSS